MDISLGHVIYVLRLFLLGTPGASAWMTILLWVARLVTLSLIFRTYIGPFILTQISDHIRVRSISLRSIRGLYFRRGSRIWRVERIGISYSSAAGGLSVKIMIKGLKLEIGMDDPAPSIRPPIRRNLTLADLSPSPIARRLRDFGSYVFAWLDPYFRPIFRSFAVAFLRSFIRYLPAISQAVDFDLSTAVVTFAALPGTSITIEEAKLHTSLEFTRSESATHVEERDTNSTLEKQTRSYRVIAWKSRLTNSFRRAWERAWDKTQGTASVSLKIGNVTGSSGVTFIIIFLCSNTKIVTVHNKNFLHSPAIIDLATSVRFDPKMGKLETHSLNTTLSIGELSVAVDVVHSILHTLTMNQERDPPTDIRQGLPTMSPSSPGVPLVTPGSLFSPTFPSALLSPNTATSEYPASVNSPLIEVLSVSCWCSIFWF
jgi:hypothetical protein